MKNLKCIIVFLTVVVYASLTVADDYSVSLLPAQIAELQMQIEIDISKIEPGHMIETEYMGGPVWIYRRTKQDLEYFQADRQGGLGDEKIDAIIRKIKGKVRSTTSLLRARTLMLDQPELEKSPYRSKLENYFVFSPTGRLGCSVQFDMLPHVTRVEGGVLFDPCSGDQYDSAGRFIDQGSITRSLQNGKIIRSDASISPRLEIPPHRYTPDKTLVIGVADINILPEISISKEEIYSDLTPTETLLAATAFNDIDVARSALRDGADINPPGTGPETGSLALLRAILYSSTAMVELLVTQGATPHLDEIDWAERLDRADVIELLNSEKLKK